MGKVITRQDAVDAMASDKSYLSGNGWFDSFVSRRSEDRLGRPLPWIPYAASRFIGERLTKQMHVYEFGSGASTLWYAERVASVVSVEHNPKWSQILLERLPANAELHQLEEGPYARDILQYSGRFDIVSVDGIERVNCVRNSLAALKADGVVVWDNVRRKEYAEGWAFLAEHGFRRLDFYGPAPICVGSGCTAVFYRTSNVFGI